jgi:hypothetical protein
LIDQAIYQLKTAFLTHFSFLPIFNILHIFSTFFTFFQNFSPFFQHFFHLFWVEKINISPTFLGLKNNIYPESSYKFGITKLAMPLIASGLDRTPWGSVQKIIEKVFGHSIVNIKIYTGDQDTNLEWPWIDPSVQRKQRGRMQRPSRIPVIKKDARNAAGAIKNQMDAASLSRNNEAPANTRDVPGRILSSAASPEEQPPLSGTYLGNHKRARCPAPRTTSCEPPPPGVSPARSKQTWPTSRDKEAPEKTKDTPNRTNPSSASPEVVLILPGAYLETHKQGRSCVDSEQTSVSDNCIPSFIPQTRHYVRTEKPNLHKTSQLQDSTVDEPLPPGVSLKSALPATHYIAIEKRVRVDFEVSAIEETVPPGTSPVELTSGSRNSNTFKFSNVSSMKNCDLKIYCQNIRSLNTNIKNLQLITSLDDFDLLYFTEHWAPHDFIESGGRATPRHACPPARTHHA